MFTEIEYLQFRNERQILYKSKNSPIATIGEKSYIVKAIFEDSDSSNLLIGNYCSIAHDIVFVVGLNHDFQQVTTYPLELIGKTESPNDEFPKQENTISRNVNENQILIGHDVWIGRGVCILDGVRIGNGAVVGANSVVAKNVPPYAVVAGNPAKIIKYRFNEKIIQKLQNIKWWYWNEKKIIEHKEDMRCIESFTELFYDSSMERRIANETTAKLKMWRSMGYKLVYFLPDFRTVGSVWQKVIKEYIYRYTEKEKNILIYDANPEKDIAEIEWIENLIKSKAQPPIIIENHSKKNISFDILQNVDEFITTHLYESIQCIDYGEDYGVKIISGFRNKIFD